jgi:hypothetical protein
MNFTAASHEESVLQFDMRQFRFYIKTSFFFFFFFWYQHKLKLNSLDNFQWRSTIPTITVFSRIISETKHPDRRTYNQTLFMPDNFTNAEIYLYYKIMSSAEYISALVKLSGITDIADVKL